MSSPADVEPRVLVVGPGFRFTSGISYYTLHAANALAGRVEVGALLMRRLIPRRWYPGRARVGTDLHGVAFDPRVSVHDGVDWYWGRSILEARSFLRRQAPDLVVFQWWTGAVAHTYLALVAIAKRRGARVVIEWHEVQDTGEVRVPGVAAYTRVLARRIVARADGHVVHTRSDLDALADAYGVPGERCQVVPHGPYRYLSPSSGARSSAKAGGKPAPSGVAEILWFGVVRPYKGLQDLVAAFESLSDEEAERLRLLVVGEPWEGWTEPFRAIARSPRRDRIEVVDRYVSDEEAAGFFERADGVALPYRRSSASGPLHLAMGAGKPVLITAVGGLPEAADGYEGAVIVAPDDRDALAKGLVALADRAGCRYDDPSTWDAQVDAYLRTGATRPATDAATEAGTGGAEAVTDLEIADGLPSGDLVDWLPPPPPTGWAAARLLVRAAGRPLGFVRIEDLGLERGEAAGSIAGEVGHVLTTVVTGTPSDHDLTRPLPTVPGPTGVVDDVRVTVVVCTRDRPVSLRRALTSLGRVEHRPLDVLVVDNAPSSDATRRVVDEVASASAVSIRRVVEPRPGLSNARNRAVAALADAAVDVVAWLDDDEEADPDWITQIAAAFADDPQTAAVSGLVVPSQIANATQARYEQFGGHSKGRGFRPVVFDPAAMAQSPLFPLPCFGVGANMAFRRSALVEIGGFDPALGAGTRTGAGEDTLVFTELLLAGRRVRYVPSAIVRHHHRDDEAGLHQQMHAYGKGLTAFYVAVLVRHPARIVDLLRLVPTAWGVVRDPSSLRNAGDGSGFPPDLRRANVRGMLIGPLAYLRARLAARRR
ncbi:MAG: glycosyltransferase [Desertimonas sp.]